MFRQRKLTSAAAATVAIAGLTLLGATGAASASTSGYVPLAGSVPVFAQHTAPTGTVAGSTVLTIQTWLTPQAGAAQFATAVSTPGSAQYRHYLSPSAYAARFGATAKTTGAVESWLKSKGFTAITTDAGRDYVRATGTASKIDAAFRTELKTYPRSAGSADGYTLRANATSVSVPKSLAGSVLGVTGLSNAAPISTMAFQKAKTSEKSSSSGKTYDAPCSQYYGQYKLTVPKNPVGVDPVATAGCGYTGTQMRQVYNIGSATGSGQTIALVELGLAPDMFQTLHDYAAANGLPAPSSERYAELSLGKNTCGDPFDTEEQLDVESSYAMAPGSHQLVVGGDACNDGDDGLQGLFDADLAVINGTGGHPLASVASNSWEGGTESQAPYLTNIENAYLIKAAAVGVGMYFSSGDGSGVETPSSDPYATAVGGTTLGISKTGTRLFETGWSDGLYLLLDGKWLNFGEQFAAGGGPSLLWAQPGYQKGVVPNSLATAPGNRGGLVRSVPDISADADPYTGFAVGVLETVKGKTTYVQEAIGGTSLASPLVAGQVIDAQQGQSAPFGFINPALYKLTGSKALYDTLPVTSATPQLYRAIACPENICGLVQLAQFDDQSKNLAGYTGQVTLKGYDNMTGVGAPNGASFFTALRG